MSWKIVKLLLIVYLAAFAVKVVTHHEYYVESAYASYVAAFAEEAAKRHIHLPLDNLIILSAEAGDKVLQRDDTIAICYYVPNISLVPVIYVNSYRWNKYKKESDRELIMFHELGHCWLNKAHNNAEINGTPQSIMHSIHFEGDLYWAHRDFYLEELFRGK